MCNSRISRARFSLSPLTRGWRARLPLSGATIWTYRLSLVQIQEHGRVANNGQQQILEAPQHVRSDGVQFVPAGQAHHQQLVDRHRKMIGPEMNQALDEWRVSLQGAVRPGTGGRNVLLASLAQVGFPHAAALIFRSQTRPLAAALAMSQQELRSPWRPSMPEGAQRTSRIVPITSTSDHSVSTRWGGRPGQSDSVRLRWESWRNLKRQLSSNSESLQYLQIVWSKETVSGNWLALPARSGSQKFVSLMPELMLGISFTAISWGIWQRFLRQHNVRPRPEKHGISQRRRCQSERVVADEAKDSASDYNCKAPAE